jgi:hypothetical protein
MMINFPDEDVMIFFFSEEEDGDFKLAYVFLWGG